MIFSINLSILYQNCTFLITCVNDENTHWFSSNFFNSFGITNFTQFWNASFPWFSNGIREFNNIQHLETNPYLSESALVLVLLHLPLTITFKQECLQTIFPLINAQLNYHAIQQRERLERNLHNMNINLTESTYDEPLDLRINVRVATPVDHSKEPLDLRINVKIETPDIVVDEPESLWNLPSNSNSISNSKDAELISNSISKDAELISNSISKDAELILDSISKDAELILDSISKDAELISKDAELISKDAELISKDAELISDSISKDAGVLDLSKKKSLSIRDAKRKHRRHHNHHSKNEKRTHKHKNVHGHRSKNEKNKNEHEHKHRHSKKKHSHRSKRDLSQIEENQQIEDIDEPAAKKLKIQSTLQDSIQNFSQDSIQNFSQDSIQSTSQDSIQNFSQNLIQSTSQDSIQTTSQDSIQSTLQDSIQSTLQDSIQSTLQDSIQSTLQDSIQSTSQNSIQSTFQNSIHNFSNDVEIIELKKELIDLLSSDSNSSDKLYIDMDEEKNNSTFVNSIQDTHPTSINSIQDTPSTSVNSIQDTLPTSINSIQDTPSTSVNSTQDTPLTIKISAPGMENKFIAFKKIYKKTIPSVKRTSVKQNVSHVGQNTSLIDHEYSIKNSIQSKIRDPITKQKRKLISIKLFQLLPFKNTFRFIKCKKNTLNYNTRMLLLQYPEAVEIVGARISPNINFMKEVMDELLKCNFVFRLVRNTITLEYNHIDDFIKIMSSFVSKIRILKTRIEE